MGIDVDARIEKAREYFSCGYNCAQAVTAPFCDLMGLEEKEALRLSSSFGGGFGRMREICGAVAGMGMVAGALYGEIDPADDATKASHYALVQDLASQFRAVTGSIICRDLIDSPDTRPWPDKRTAEYYSSRPCARFVDDAVRVVCKMLESRQG